MILDSKLNAGGVIVLDGATGTEISRRGVTMDNAAWCGVANTTHPDVVREVHKDYIRAGADVVTANTFATCRHVLESAGLGDETVAINRRAVELAREARDAVEPTRPVAIAGSMSTMRAWMPGTVDPDPRYIAGPEKEAANFREMAEVLAEAGADLIVMEMMLEIERATSAVAAAVATGLPVWVGISCSRRPDGRLVGWDALAEMMSSRLGDAPQPRPEVALDEMIEQLTQLGGTVAGIMHTKAENVSPGLELLRQRWSGPMMAYPETIDMQGQGGYHQTHPTDFAAHCREWIDEGVQIIGGCCGTTVEHIRELVDSLDGATSG